MSSPADVAVMDMSGPPLPMFPLDEELPDFDYGDFLQPGEDIGYMGGDDSPTGASSGSAQFNAVSHSSSSLTKAGSPPKQRLERRGHTKSRRGCYNCKRRRIKCQETRPACGHCTKTGLKCEYPALPSVTHQPQNSIPLFSLQDMRFFQHFLQQCYPHYPIASEGLWTHEIPQLSHRYEYLMHAILGMAATDLMDHDPSVMEAAMYHRLKAIKAIKKSLTSVQSPDAFAEGNALMATCFTLTFQSVNLDDGMTEYMTFIRGIIIVAIQMYIKGATLLFADFIGDKQDERLAPYLEKVPLIPAEWAQSAIVSIRALEPLCTNPVEKHYHTLLADWSEQLLVSSVKAYKALSRHYGWWMMLPHDQFQRLVDPNNQVSVVLATHWIALQQIMCKITDAEKEAMTKTNRENKKGVDLGIVRWLKYLNQQLDMEHVGYNQWPAWVEAQLDMDRTYFGRTESV